MKPSFKLLTLSLAGASLLASGSQFSFAENGDPATTANPTAVPISTAMEHGAVKFTTKTVQEKTDEVTLDLQIPVIQGLQDRPYQDELNGMIYRSAMKDADELRQRAKIDAANAKEGGFEFSPYSLTLRYEAKADGGLANANYVSLAITTYTDTHGAHGMPLITTYNVLDAAQAKRVELKDLFGSKYKEIINKQIQAEIDKHPDDYLKDSFKGISDDQAFYIENGKAVIVFQAYDIAPYAAGNPKFPIVIPQGAESGSNPGTSSSTQPIRVKVNGKALTSDEATLYFSEDGITLAPLRVIAGGLGYTIKWNEEQHAAEVSKGAQWTSVYVGRDSYTYNRMAPFTLGATPVIEADGNMYVPVAFFTKVLQADVQVEGDTFNISTPQ